MDRTDRDLIERTAAGDADAFEVLFARHRASICRHVTRMLQDESAANDLTQEVFLRVWTRVQGWEERGSVRALLLRIATNLALNYLRDRMRLCEEPLDAQREPRDPERPVPGWAVDSAAISPDTIYQLAERRRRLWELVDRLPEEKREVVRLLHEAGLDVREVAEALGIPEGTVRSRMHYARKRLAREWLELDAE